jgi:pheromone shutdown-related protein TraB
MSSDTAPALSENNVDRCTIDGREILLVGTAHISAQSVELVERVIREKRPDSVAIELCEGRYKNLKDPDRWRETDLVAIIRQGKAYVLIAQLLLSSFQRRMGDKLKIKPGAEMMAAAKMAEEVGAHIQLADRDITTTLKRAWRSLGFKGIFKLCYSLLLSFVERPPEITEADIERLKQSDALEEALKELSQVFPEVRSALIDERDQFLAQKIREAPGNTVVAVVGAAHVPGIKRYMESNTDLSTLSTVPPKSFFSKALSWVIPVIVIGGMGFAFIDSGSATFAEMFKTWFWITGLAGAIGAALVLAHPVTIIAGFISAPWAAINPFIAAGWVTGIVEAMVRKPRVKDLETIAQDITSVRGLFTNRVCRTLLLVAVTNLCVMAGMVIATTEVISIATTSEAPKN